MDDTPFIKAMGDARGRGGGASAGDEFVGVVVCRPGVAVGEIHTGSLPVNRDLKEEERPVGGAYLSQAG